MGTCSVCGEVDDHLLNTCNHCEKKHCPEHQLPENHVCIPSKSDITDAPGSSSKWFSEKHDRSNVMADESRGESERVGSSDDDSGTSSYPHDAASERRKNRERMNRRLSSSNSSSSNTNSSASTPPSPRTSSSNTESSTSTPSRIPSPLWIIVLLALLVIAYLVIGSV